MAQKARNPQLRNHTRLYMCNRCGYISIINPSVLINGQVEMNEE